MDNMGRRIQAISLTTISSVKIIVLIFLLKSPAGGNWADEKSSFVNINTWRPTGGKPLTKPVMAQFSETYAALTKCYLIQLSSICQCQELIGSSEILTTVYRLYINPSRPAQNGPCYANDIFKYICWKDNCLIFISIQMSVNCTPMGPDSQHWFRKWLGRT